METTIEIKRLTASYLAKIKRIDEAIQSDKDALKAIRHKSGELSHEREEKEYPLRESLANYRKDRQLIIKFVSNLEGVLSLHVSAMKCANKNQ